MLSLLQVVSDYNAINLSIASGDFGRLLITSANSLGPYQDRQNVGCDLDPNLFPTENIYTQMIGGNCVFGQIDRI